MNWRKWNYAVHRDLGFLCIGLTLVYALSGIAVNHVNDWNPNYVIERVAASIKPLPPGLVDPLTIPQLLQQLGESGAHENTFQPDADNLWIYIDQRMIKVHLPSGQVQQELFKRRSFWYPLNFLHLNHPKKAWTWVADIYAAALFLLAVSGLLMVSKKTGLKRRGLVLTAAGVLLPLLFLQLYY
ncbi:MAG TPA: PepSY-associated TM helix domain-containing protein [Malonomonas sp.]